MKFYLFSVFVLFALNKRLTNCVQTNDHGSQNSNHGSGHSWNYEEYGPDAWAHSFEKCAGKQQSPINIVKNNLEYDRNLKPFKFINYDAPLNWNLTHNGHTVVANAIHEDMHKTVVGVEGSDLDEQYNLLQFHFHWGYNDFQGSEHLIDAEKFPLEVHFVHRSNSQKYTVLGFLFKISQENNPELNELLDSISKVKDEQNWEKVNLKLEKILPESSTLNKYYRYSGSLTTPPCTEGIKWNVFATYINISREQLASIRTNKLKINYREPQKLYERKVFSSFPISSSSNKKNDAHNSKDHKNTNKDVQKPCPSNRGNLNQSNIIFSIISFVYVLLMNFIF